MKDVIEEATENRKPVGGKALVLPRRRRRSRSAREQGGTEYISKKNQDSGLLLQSTREDARLLRRKSAKCEQGSVERRANLQ